LAGKDEAGESNRRTTQNQASTSSTFDALRRATANVSFSGLRMAGDFWVLSRNCFYVIIFYVTIKSVEKCGLSIISLGEKNGKIRSASQRGVLDGYEVACGGQPPFKNGEGH
jgi:hypothetical protein